MIISQQRSYIFVHIPKTGGTALALALERRAAKDDILIGDAPKAVRRRNRLKSVQTAGRLWKHSTLADVEGLVTRADMARMYVVTLVRNPWDRLASLYFWLREQGFDHPLVSRAKVLDFNGFLNDPATLAGVKAHPFDSYTCDAAGTDHVNLQVRLEHWRDDLAPFAAHVGFAIDMPHANRSDRAKDWRGYYSDADAALVAQICATDIVRHAYRFDPD